VLGGQQLSWPPGVPKIEEQIAELKISEPPALVEPKQEGATETDKQKLKKEMFVRELGFSMVVETMINA
jgi:hypothetical protein